MIRNLSTSSIAFTLLFTLGRSALAQSSEPAPGAQGSSLPSSSSSGSGAAAPPPLREAQPAPAAPPEPAPPPASQQFAPPPAPPPSVPPPAPQQVAPPAAAAVPAPEPSAPTGVAAAAPPQPLVAPPAAAQAPNGLAVQILSLRIMRDKGILTPAEYAEAVRDLSDSVGLLTPNQQSLVVGKWATTLYGFVEADSIWDSTRSLNDLSGNSLIALAGTTAGDNSRVQFGVRNSRIGLRMAAPEYHAVRATGTIEADFLGTQLPIETGPYPATVSPSPYGTEASYFTNPTFRIRHANLKIETPVVDILFGQYWQLFGWQPVYQPNTVEIQGIAGEVYSRTPQLRISKTVRAYPITFEAAIAAVRPFQRDAGTPDGEGGLRFAVDSWTGLQTVGATGTQIAPLSFAVTGLVRHVAVNSFPPNGSNTTDLTMGAFAADAYVPVLPATRDRQGNSLSFNGEFATGYGDADMYTGLTGGVGFPSPATGSYSPDIDPGVVTFDTSGNLHAIQWTSYLVGAQYSLPGLDGKVWVSGNYSHMNSANMHDFAVGGTLGSNKSLMGSEDWFDTNLFIDPIPSIRFGIEYANTKTTYVAGIQAINHRGQLSGFFIF